MKLTDGKRTINIRMSCWDGTQYSPDFSNDFFEVGNLPRIWVDVINEEAYKVPDVGYCIDQAEDWANYRGDCYDPDAQKEDQEKGVERSVNVEELTQVSRQEMSFPAD